MYAELNFHQFASLPSKHPLLNTSASAHQQQQIFNSFLKSINYFFGSRNKKKHKIKNGLQMIIFISEDFKIYARLKDINLHSTGNDLAYIFGKFIHKSCNIAISWIRTEKLFCVCACLGVLFPLFNLMV